MALKQLINIRDPESGDYLHTIQRRVWEAFVDSKNYTSKSMIKKLKESTDELDISKRYLKGK